MFGLLDFGFQGTQLWLQHTCVKHKINTCFCVLHFYYWMCRNNISVWVKRPTGGEKEIQFYRVILYTLNRNADDLFLLGWLGRFIVHLILFLTLQVDSSPRSASPCGWSRPRVGFSSPVWLQDHSASPPLSPWLPPLFVFSSFLF